MEVSPLHERLRSIVGTQSYRRIGELTGTNAETVRRYLLGQTPSVEFLASICDKFLVNAEWLLSGRGPMRTKEIRAHALQHATAAELLNAMARTLERLTERVERLELFVQTLETRLHCAAIRTTPPLSSTPDAQPQDRTIQAEAQAQRPADAADGAAARPSDGSSAQVEVRIRRIADAVAQRPPAADG